MVVELGPRDGDPVRGTLNVEQTIVKVLVADDARVGEIEMVDPDVGAALGLNKVAAPGRHAEMKVAQDDVVDLVHPQATSSQAGFGTEAENRGVVLYTEDAAAINDSTDVNNAAVLQSRRELAACGHDNRRGIASASGGSAVADKLVDSSVATLSHCSADSSEQGQSDLAVQHVCRSSQDIIRPWKNAGDRFRSFERLVM